MDSSPHYYLLWQPFPTILISKVTERATRVGAATANRERVKSSVLDNGVWLRSKRYKLESVALIPKAEGEGT
jgi:hypothetical protein